MCPAGDIAPPAPAYSYAPESICNGDGSKLKVGGIWASVLTVIPQLEISLIELEKSANN